MTQHIIMPKNEFIEMMRKALNEQMPGMADNTDIKVSLRGKNHKMADFESIVIEVTRNTGE